ncbi:hypothetical protein GWI33_010514 [Rhynchophorus ferrugineus]|uniref:Transposase n=1 Tax=Rhynchophorus ferrugineus TaxID=354439 RepID=A0A834ISI8_RHYFE|nr:hypothetical protein GWI33_010514 [Rhynchophorus ferrugineus]
MDKRKFRVLIKYCFLKGKNTVEAKTWLDAEKLSAKWVPSEFTFDKKLRQIDDSEQCLKMIKRNKPEFLHRYVTIDEIWLHHDYLKKGRTINSDYYIGLCWNIRKCCFTKTMHRVKNPLIASSSTVFSRSGPQRLFPVLRYQKNARWEENFARKLCFTMIGRGLFN